MNCSENGLEVLTVMDRVGLRWGKQDPVCAQNLSSRPLLARLQVRLLSPPVYIDPYR